MTEQLASFIKFLDDNQLIDFSVLKNDSPEGFNNRLKAQKYVYFAQERFNFDLGYYFNKYKRGPYSTKLTEDYYNIRIFQSEKENTGYYDSVVETDDYFEFGVVPLHNSFDKKGFLEAVSNKNEDWLEVASTLIDVSKSYPDKSEVLEMIKRIKPRFESSYIKQVFDDLLKYGLMESQ